VDVRNPSENTASNPSGQTDPRGRSGIDVRRVPELSKQFLAEAHAGYHFYTRDLDWDEINRMSRVRRAIFVSRAFFRSVLAKLSPARRMFLLAAVVFYFFGRLEFHPAKNATVQINFQFLGFLILFTLLLLELSDRVTMKRDLEIAREIQSWLVPAEPPAVPKAEIAFATRPQNSVAGDYYDAFYAPAESGRVNKLLVVIADVAGKSVPAALLMATFQASLRTIARQGISLHRTVLLLNEYACAHSLGGLRFTTAVLAEFDPASRRLAYVNAGHNAPVLRRATGTIERLETGGLPLGIIPTAVYETAAVDLHPGDALIFYTDGVVEALNQRGEEYGESRWIDAITTLPEVSAQESLQILMRGVDQFVGVTRQFDDITCLVFRSK
jgi:serine phosphatase RsbU (regulator of sigma subunit)